MARYATNEEQYHCDRCDKWIAEREMVSTGIFMNASRERNETFSAYCPGCKVTKWTKIITLGAVDPVLNNSGAYIVQSAQPGAVIKWKGGEGTGRSYFTEGMPENWPYELINDDELL